MYSTDSLCRPGLAGYSGLAGSSSVSARCVSMPTMCHYTNSLSCGRFPHIKLEPASITGKGSCLPRSDGRSCSQGVLIARELWPRSQRQVRGGTDTAVPNTFENSQTRDGKRCSAVDIALLLPAAVYCRWQHVPVRTACVIRVTDRQTDRDAGHRSIRTVLYHANAGMAP
jgi:hypothetical protein